MSQLFGFLPLLLGVPEGAGTGGAPGGQMVSLLVTFGLIILIFYFLIIRPQSRKQKETQRMLSALKKGDRVVTAGGIHGTVTAVKEDTVTVRVDDNVKLELNRSAISTIVDAAQGSRADQSRQPREKQRNGKGKAQRPAADSGGGESGAVAEEAAEAETDEAEADREEG